VYFLLFHDIRCLYKVFVVQRTFKVSENSFLSSSQKSTYSLSFYEENEANISEYELSCENALRDGESHAICVCKAISRYRMPLMRSWFLQRTFEASDNSFSHVLF
jgi:hypothetical protein